MKIKKLKKKASANVFWHKPTITRSHRESLLGHRSAVLWFTGLSGAGKSTLAHAVEDELHRLGSLTTVLDGDNVRHGLCSDLTFSEEDRVENIRRVSEVAKLIVHTSTIVLTAFISPFRSDRDRAREVIGNDDFIEVHCKASLDVCENRDVKGLYEKARAGEIPHFTGISSPYEEPENPDLVVETGARPLEQCVNQVIRFLAGRGLVRLPHGHPARIGLHHREDIMPRCACVAAHAHAINAQPEESLHV